MPEPEGQPPASTDRIIMLTPAGRRKSVPVTSVKQAQAQGWREETAEDRSPSALAAFGRSAVAGLGDAILAAPKLVTGLAGALPGAAPDPLANVSGRSLMADTGMAKASTMRADVEAHPWASKAGEIAGQLPVLAAGGGALEGATLAGAEGAGLVGGAAELGGEVGASVLTGAGLGASAASEEAWIKNENLTSEAMLSSIGTGAIFGAVTPFAIRGAGKALGSIRKAITGGAPAAEEAAALAPTSVLSGETEAATEHGAVDSVSDSWLGKVRQKANGIADEKAVDALTRGQVTFISKMPGAVKGIASADAKREVGEMLHDMGIVKAGYSSTEMADAAVAAREKAGQQIGAIVEAADATGAPVDTTLLKRDAYKLLFELGNPASKRLGLSEGNAAANEVRSRMMSIADEIESGTLTHAQLHDFRMQLSDAAKYSTQIQAPSATIGAIRDLRSAVSETLGRSIKEADPDLGDAWITANKRFSVAKWAENTATKQASKSHGTTLGLNDYVAGAGVLAASSNPLTAAGAILGKKVLQERGSATMAAMLKEFAAGSVDIASAPSSATRLARTLQAFGIHTADAADTAIKGFLSGKGSSIPDLAADVVGLAVKGGKAAVRAAEHSSKVAVELGTHHGIEHAATQTGLVAGHEGAEHATERAAERVVSGPRFAVQQSVATALRSANVNEARAAYAKHAEDVGTVASNPQLAMDRVQRITGTNLPNVAPSLHTAIIAKAGAAAQYLQAHMPAPPTDPHSITPHVKSQPPISDTDLRIYANRVEAVETPLKVLQNFAKGKVFPEQIDAIKTVYPELYAQWGQMLAANLAEQTKPVPYDKRVVMELAFGGTGALEPSLDPAFLQTMRTVGAQGQQQKPGAPVPAASKSLAPRSAQISGAMR